VRCSHWSDSSNSLLSAIVGCQQSANTAVVLIDSGSCAVVHAEVVQSSHVRHHGWMIKAAVSCDVAVCM